MGRNGGLHGGHSLSKGARGESLQVSLVKVALAPSVSHKALSQEPPLHKAKVWPGLVTLRRGEISW